MYTAGEIWEVQAIAARETTNAPTGVFFVVTVNGMDLYLRSETASLAAGWWYTWTGKIVLSAGDRVRAVFYGSTDGDTLVMRYHAVRIDIDQ